MDLERLTCDDNVLAIDEECDYRASRNSVGILKYSQNLAWFMKSHFQIKQDYDFIFAHRDCWHQ